MRIYLLDRNLYYIIHAFYNIVAYHTLLCVSLPHTSHLSRCGDALDFPVSIIFLVLHKCITNHNIATKSVTL